MSNFKYPKGSEWRKWDLQIHTPFSILNNQFGNPNEENVWENYMRELFRKAIEKNIAVIGITDYFTVEGYKKIKNEYLDNDSKLKSLFTNDEVEKIRGILLLPNIEFRLNTFVGRDSINFHVIFSEKISINDIEENFLHEIDFVYEGNPQSQDEKWKLKIENLRNLGEKLKKEHTNFKDQDSLLVGMKNAVVSDSQILEILNQKPSIFKDKFFTILPADEDLSNIDWNSRDHNVKKVLIQKSDILFSSNKKTRNWALGYKHSKIEDFITEFKSLKPCVWSSDAHSIHKLFEPDLKRHTWINADPTFEGLKQIIYEPGERCYIGEEPFSKIEKTKIIKSITVSNSNKWFEDNNSILINDGLISIIGGKGTGKTAILDLVAYATGSYKCFEKDESKSKSFLKKAFRELKGSKIKVEWEEGDPNKITIGDKLEECTKEGKVRYLPQDYVDQLCTEIGKSELEEQIENVFFQKIPSENKASFSDFKSYKEAQLKVINYKKKRVSKQIEEINSTIYEHRNLIESKGEKEERRKNVEGETQKLKKKMKEISRALKDSKAEKILKKLSSYTEKSSDSEKDISELKNKILQIEKIENDVSEFLEDSEGFIGRLKTELKEIGIAQEIINKVEIVLHPGNLQQVFKNRKKEIEEKITKQKGQLGDTNKNIKNLDSKIELEKSKQDKIMEINTSLSELRKKKNSLVYDIEKIEDAKEKLPQLLNERENIFINYFELIFEEKGKLKDIYSPLENILKESGEENERLFDFTVKLNFDVSSMADEGHELIDLRAEGKFHHSKRESFREELEKLRFELNLNNEQISENNKNTIKEFSKKVEQFFTKNKRTIISQLKEKRYTEQDFDDWLYHTKYYNISYSIKFNDIELNNLSPGLKGVALLILFLELDKEDRRPILIDQPEENLDNRSVYNTLVKYFRNAKKRRQVMIVTHNPNLVVNTDSEQVIVADFDRGLNKQNSRILYVSGSLENTFKDGSASINLEKQGIREHVCEILEGGREAFEKREKKYGFKTT